MVLESYLIVGHIYLNQMHIQMLKFCNLGEKLLSNKELCFMENVTNIKFADKFSTKLTNFKFDI